MRLAAPFLLSGNTKGFALSFPKQNSRPRVAVAARPLARARASIQLSLPLPSSPEGRPHVADSAAVSRRKGYTMTDTLLVYRACGVETREDWLRMLADDNGLPLATVTRAAERFGEAGQFTELVTFCETRAKTVQ